MRRVAIIPARGGSKRIPRKNIRLLRGRPMIAYTIDAAKASGLFERIVVSTDNFDIAHLALEFGADVPFLRDSSLADDQTPVSAATVDALRQLSAQGADFDIAAQLMANCPLRTAEDLRTSWNSFQNRSAPVQISVTRYGWTNPWWAMKTGTDGLLQPLFPDQITFRSQDLPELFCPTGAIWWAHVEPLLHAGTFHVANRTGWEIPWPRGLDIDSEDDWRIAEALLSQPDNTVSQTG